MVEIQVGPVSAILGLGLIALVVARRRPAGCLVTFALGAAIPTALLLGYNQVAFDSPWRMGYFFLVMDRFKEVHSAANPLGLTGPTWPGSASCSGASGAGSSLRADRGPGPVRPDPARWSDAGGPWPGRSRRS